MNREFRRHPTHPALPILPVSKKRIPDKKIRNSAVDSMGKGRISSRNSKGRESKSTDF